MGPVMPREPSSPDRLLVALTWPAGIALTSWAYMWRTTVLHRRELAGRLPDDGPPPLPEGADLAEVQRPDDGYGPLLNRRYRVLVRGARLGPDELIARVGADPNRVAPRALARFHKVAGAGGAMRPGDEFSVRMPGPYNGPVRAVEVTPASFRFVTLAGHLEAGQIEWRARRDDGLLVFEVQSWACAGDRLSYLLHHRLRMAKEVQLHMWTSVCERVARLAGGRITGGIDIETRRAE
jgi:hypothetical protein